jgi:hypothetical protein
MTFKLIRYFQDAVWFKSAANSEAEISQNVTKLTILLDSNDFERPRYKW